MEILAVGSLSEKWIFEVVILQRLSVCPIKKANELIYVHIILHFKDFTTSFMKKCIANNRLK